MAASCKPFIKFITGLLAFNALMMLTPGVLPAQRPPVIRSRAPVPSKKIVKYGIASYYAKGFHGRRTSNGAIYNSRKLSAACNVLPLGTWVKVTNVRNKKFVIVMINDRLHRKNRRLIDLSKFAAQKLAYTKKGITRVRVEVINKPRMS